MHEYVGGAITKNELCWMIFGIICKEIPGALLNRNTNQANNGALNVIMFRNQVEMATENNNLLEHFVKLLNSISIFSTLIGT